MTKRLLSQFTVWFLLGIAGAYLGSSTWIFGVGAIGILWYVTGFYVQYRKLDSREKQLKKRYIVFFLTPLICCFCIGILGFFRGEQQKKRILETESYLENHSNITAKGRIYKKEVKNKKILYYLKDSNYYDNSQKKKCNKILGVPGEQETAGGGQLYRRYHDFYPAGSLPG